MKIVSLNTDHTNTNYINCLNHAMLIIGKEEPDIIAFHEVRSGSYGSLKEYLLFKDVFCSELEESIRLNKTFGELLFVRKTLGRFDSEYDPETNTTAYIYKDKLIAISRQLKDLNVTKFIKSFTLPNGNIRPTILIDPENVYCLTTTDARLVPYVKQKESGAGKYPINIGNINS